MGARVIPQILDLQETEEHSELDTKKGMVVVGKVIATPLEETFVEGDPLGYTSKQEATNAFKVMLEPVNVC